MRRWIIHYPYQRFYSISTAGPNAAILEMLRRHKHIEELQSTKNLFKVKAFSSAMAVISALKEPITSGQQALKLKGVGSGIAERIDLFLSGKPFEGDSEEAIKTRNEEALKRHARAALQTVPALGPVTARNLVQQGCLSVAQLRDKSLPFFNQLTNAQKIGAKYFAEIEKRVQRNEAEAVVKFISHNVSCKFHHLLVGSYRRGSPTSSEIDIILFHPDHVHVPVPTIASPFSSYADTLKESSSPPPKPKKMRSSSKKSPPIPRSSLLIDQIITPLTDRGLIAETVTSGPRKWQGIVRIPEVEDVPQGHHIGNGGVYAQGIRREAVSKGQGRYRRMNLTLCPLRSYGAALISQTGDSIFNRDLSARAIKSGMYLNEFGLWRWRANEESSDSSEETAASSSSSPSSSPTSLLDGLGSTNKSALEAIVQEEISQGLCTLLNLTSTKDDEATTTTTTTTSTTPPSIQLSSKSRKRKSPTPPTANATPTINGGGFWELLKMSNEAEIMNELGMEYVVPEKRNFGFLVENIRRRR